MSDKPRVSIGVPVYNAARYLPVTLDALLAQTYRDFEIVISDNASTDGTEAICRRYAARDPRVRYSREAVNRGAVWNFNRTFELARGEFFKWAAHDDLCAPTYLQSCMEILDRHPDVVWCHTRWQVIDAAGRRIECADPGPPRGRCSPMCYERLRDIVLSQRGWTDFYSVVRVSAMKRTQLHQPFYGGDKAFLGELSLLGRYAEVPEVLFYLRRHQACSGGLVSPVEQQRWSNSSVRPGFVFLEAKLAASYVASIRKHTRAAHDRFRCMMAVGAYAFQVRKWKKVVTRAFSASLMNLLANRSRRSRRPAQEQLAQSANS